MKVIKFFSKILFYIVGGIIGFVIMSLILTYIPVNGNPEVNNEMNKSIFINTNGVHVDIIMHKQSISANLLEGLKIYPQDQFLAFGWGEKEFYLNTPEWSDLTVGTALNAMLVKSPSVMHVSRFIDREKNWVEIKLSEKQLAIINKHIQNSFFFDAKKDKVLLAHAGYTNMDDFYAGVGGYSCLKTSNTWVNSIFKKANIDACLWTPFSFRLISMHRNQ